MLAVAAQGCTTVSAVSFGVPSSVCEGRMQELACPSQDFDGDGVANAADLCPEEAARTRDGCAAQARSPRAESRGAREVTELLESSLDFARDERSPCHQFREACTTSHELGALTASSHECGEGEAQTNSGLRSAMDCRRAITASSTSAAKGENK